MEKKEIKVGDRIIPVEAGKVIPMTKEEWKKFQKQMKVERDYFYMIGNKKYIHYEDEDYVRVSDIEQELDKAREEGIKEYIDLLQGIEHYEGLKMVRGLVGLDKHEKRDYYNLQRRFEELSKLNNK